MRKDHSPPSPSPIHPPLMSTMSRPRIVLHLPSRSGSSPNIPPALSTELAMGHTTIVLLYDDDEPLSEVEDQPQGFLKPEELPPLQRRKRRKLQVAEEAEEEVEKIGSMVEIILPQSRNWQGKKKCRSYTLKKKKSLVQINDSHIASLKLSQRESCVKEGLDESMNQRWKKIFVEEDAPIKRKGMRLSSSRQKGGGC